MTERQARATVAGIALVIAAVIAALAWGRAAVDIVLVAALLWVLWETATTHTRSDEGRDMADQALRGLDDVKDYLHGTEEPSTGRHASRRAA